MRECDNKFIQIEKQINSWELRFWNTEGSDIRERYSSNEHLKNLLVDRADLKILEARVDEKLERLVQNISDLTKKVGLNNKNLKFNLKTLENTIANTLLSKAKKFRNRTVPIRRNQRPAFWNIPKISKNRRKSSKNKKAKKIKKSYITRNKNL